ncbi:MAG: HigA family addiction module antidote protein [Methyloprofundus sp.]|nr:HigA family addiction module antidote protein [Methyloprofundus sp.]
MRKRNRPPIHPGEIIKYDYLEPLSLSVTELAKHLHTSRVTASNIVNTHAPVTADMALRLAKAFNTSAELWLGLQKQYDLWHAEHDSDEWQQASILPILSHHITPA